MKESIQKYFSVGTILWMSYPQIMHKNTSETFEEVLGKILRDDYFDCIELTQITDEGQREKVRRLLEQSHMKICYGAQPRLLQTGLNPNDIDEEKRKMAEQTLIEGVDEAAYIGADSVAFLAGKWNEQIKEQAYQQLLKTTVNVCNYAAEKGIHVNLEVFDFDCDKAVLIGPAPLAARFAADVRCRCSNFGIMVDLSHFPTTYETSRFVIQTLRPYICHFHIGNAVVKPDCDAYGDKHPRFGYPNSQNDTAQLLEFFRILKTEGFFREDEPLALSCEVSPRPGEDADIILANTKRVINRAWALLEDEK